MKFMNWLKCYGVNKSRDSELRQDDTESGEFGNIPHSSRRHPRSRHTTTWSNISIISANSTSLEGDGIFENLGQTDAKELPYGLNTPASETKEIQQGTGTESLVLVQEEQVASIKLHVSDEEPHEKKATHDDTVFCNESIEVVDGNESPEDAAEASHPPKRSLLTVIKDEFRRACAPAMKEPTRQKYSDRCFLDSQWDSIFADLFHLHHWSPHPTDIHKMHPSGDSCDSCHSVKQLASPGTPSFYQNCHCCRCHPQAYPCMIPWLFPHDLLNYCKYCNPCELCQPVKSTSNKNVKKYPKNAQLAC